MSNIEEMSNQKGETLSDEGCEGLLKALKFVEYFKDNDAVSITWGYRNNTEYNCDDKNICKKNKPDEIQWMCETIAEGKNDMQPSIVNGIIQSFLSPGAGSLQTRIDDIQNAAMSTEPNMEARVKLSANKTELCTRSSKHNLFATVVTDLKPEIHRLDIDLSLRSFDEMVYFVGETLRGKDDDEKPQTLTVNYCEGKPVPLFTYDTKFELQTHAVTVSHAGKNYSILHKSKPTASCSADRSGTVLSLLSQILLFNQSEEFLQAPDNLLLQ